MENEHLQYEKVSMEGNGRNNCAREQLSITVSTFKIRTRFKIIEHALSQANLHPATLPRGSS